MPEVDEPEDRASDDLTGPSASDIVLHVGEYIASVVPVVGGPLGKTLALVRESRDKRIPSMVADLAVRFDQLGDRLDEEFVATADYADRWESTMDEAARARQAGKREFYLRALAAIARKERPSLADWDFHLETLHRIDNAGLRVLAAAIGGGVTLLDTQTQWAFLRAEVPEMDEVSLARCWDDLAALGLFAVRTVLVADVHAGPADAEGLVTEYGQRFVRFMGLAGHGGDG